LGILIFQEGKTTFERLKQRPLWKTLKAVQKGQVYLVNNQFLPQFLL
jgi:ABC-type Fe3+-hydroxamate transport system substrate-binding protein